ncbi:MAG TPA: peptidylprolyl isomerase [Flavobacteriales bacterium]|jgi:FKBP-type peptidyl-prolyl cis-trans isomerase FkpA|nr:peptidylprolyl isomerase [Flavobacteriales bacterium]
MRQVILKTLIISTLFASCTEERNIDTGVSDVEKIQQYVAENGLNALATPSGLHVVVEDPGAGDSAYFDAIVKVNYKGYLLDGTVFDQSAPDQPIHGSLRAFIPGWQEGLPYFKEGGSGTLLIPSRLGYGNQQVGTIPPNSVLIFDIELLQVD